MKPQTILKPQQIRAARALLDWSQDDLAEASCLSIATIRKLESGSISPRGKTQTSLFSAFDEAGLEFLDPDGVRHRPEEIAVYQGEHGVRDFYDDVYETARTNRGDMIAVAANPNIYFDLMGEDADFYHQRMSGLKCEISVRCLLTDERQKLPASSYCEYRMLSKDYMNSVPFLIYGNKTALRTLTRESSAKIVVLHSKLVADSFRCQFDSMWAKGIPLNTVEKKRNKR